MQDHDGTWPSNQHSVRHMKGRGKDNYLKLHNVGVLAALAEVQELPAQHCLAVLTPWDEPASLPSTSALRYNNGRTNVTCCLPFETVRDSDRRAWWLALSFICKKSDPTFRGTKNKENTHSLGRHINEESETRHCQGCKAEKATRREDRQPGSTHLIATRSHVSVF